MRYSAFQFSYIVFSKCARVCIHGPSNHYSLSFSAWMVYFFMMASLMVFGLIFYILFKNFLHLGVHIWSWIMWAIALTSCQYLCIIIQNIFYFYLRSSIPPSPPPLPSQGTFGVGGSDAPGTIIPLSFCIPGRQELLKNQFCAPQIQVSI